MTPEPEWPCPALHDEPLAPRTTVRVGGRAEILLEPATPDDFADAYRVALERGFRPRVLGGGANLLVEDGLHPGVVITTARMSRVFRPNQLEGRDWHTSDEHRETNGGLGISSGTAGETPELVAWAGQPMPGLVRAARDLGWSGLEGLVGVPGHVGGGVAMNAGGRWGNMWDVVKQVRVLTPDGELEDRAREECDPKYRDGNLGDAIVLGAVLALSAGNRLLIQETMKQYLFEKSAAQPVTERSSGCIFKNPDPELSDGRSAGKLIDDCGAKGLEEGDAIVSPKHGNFIVNRGSARAADVMALIEAVRRKVADATGIELETEVKVWRVEALASD